MQYPRDNPHVLAQGGKIIKLFVDAGAHLDVVNASGLTPAQVGNAGWWYKINFNQIKF